MTALCVIRYRYPGTTGGRHVGEVYVRDIADCIPTMSSRRVFSYAKDPAKATHFTQSEAERLAYKWPGCTIESLAEARVIA